MSKCRYDLLEDCNNKDCVKCVLDKIRAETLSIGKYAEYRELMPNFELEQVIQIIDKYRGEEDETSN